MSFFEKSKLNIQKKISGQQQEKANEPGWMKHLEEMRKERKTQDSDGELISRKRDIGNKSQTRQQNSNSKTKRSSLFKKDDTKNLSPRLKNKLYQHYLDKWQSEKNNLSNNTDSQILLTKEWSLQSDNILMKSQSITEEEYEVLQFNEDQELEKIPEEELLATNSTDGENGEEIDPAVHLNVTVVKPNLDPTKKLCVIDEHEFIERIKSQLKPQLQDLVECSIKNMLLNNYEIMLSCIHQEVQTEIPHLIEEALEINFTKLIKK